MAVRVSTGYATALLGGQGFASIFHNGVIEVRSGVQPASADAAVTGDLLGYITRNGDAFTPGSPTNGLQLQQAGRLMLIQNGHLWVLYGTAEGTAGWFRLRGNAPDNGGASLTLPRIDGAIGQMEAAGDYQMRMTNVAIAPGIAVALTQWIYAIPPLGEE